ncbi:uncharacterized protein STEHIDRAFT_119054 [Stereum hirsutum FP-91666 SS1]|uniref:uncharacterized protein n=1 Tax=Stereum hirsutum (strain FP-91666) TaxID=721885 RepID=UPI000440AA8D|nr:uncharacterized protein STEHIDRAFT_119054 [Stereum hirsutum FP-91666 SS1]EIM89987.1 hypothetical protein STEHIDRAFT_119054 [Stereum hirsutum FP-91666 SS1]
MCHRRRVTNTYLCGHEITSPDEDIHCDSRWCKFSPNHPRDCVPPQCTQTCAQARMSPHMINPHPNSMCPFCLQAGVTPRR